MWRKYSSSTSWCTLSGRTLISAGEEIDHIECQKSCQAISGCNAIEFWEAIEFLACFQCTNTSLVTPYTNKNDWAYPVYVWVPEGKKDENNINKTSSFHISYDSSSFREIVSKNTKCSIITVQSDEFFIFIFFLFESPKLLAILTFQY